MAKLKLKKNPFGFLGTVTNPKGTKPLVKIGETNRGFTASVKPKDGNWNKAKVIGVSNNAEELAVKLALKGHKRVEIID